MVRLELRLEKPLDGFAGVERALVDRAILLPVEPSEGRRVESIVGSHQPTTLADDSLYRQAIPILLGDQESVGRAAETAGLRRSEEHTSELQSQSNLVCRLLLEKKKKETQQLTINRYSN